MRKMFKEVVLGLFFAAGTFLLTQCASTSLVESWKDSGIKSYDVKSILVLSINNSESKRRIWEDAFVAALVKRGVKARPAYKYFPKEIPKTDELNKVFTKDFDAVIMIKKVDEEEYRYRTPGYYYSTPFFHRYSGLYMGWYVPGYVERGKIYDIETSVYHNSDDGKLIWTSVTKTYGVKPTREFSREITNLVIPKMARDGLIRSN